MARKKRKFDASGQKKVDRSKLQQDETGALVGKGFLRPSKAKGKLRPAEEPKKKEEPSPTIQLGKPKEDVIQLGGKKEVDSSIKGQIERAKDLPGPLAILASPKTTAILATTLGILTGISAVQSAAAVGKSASAAALNINIIRAGGSAFYKTNSATLAKTTSMITKIAIQLGKPRLVASVIAGLTVGAIGSYPFAGFIKEEALQAIKGSYTGAMIQGNMDAAQLAIDERKEILNPNLTERILSTIPYVNVVKQLKDYFDTARTAVSIDQQLIDKQIIQQETGDTDEEYWANIDKERAAAKEQERIDDAAYFEQVRQNTKEAKKAERKADQKYWDKIFADQEKRKQAQREAEEAYWAAVRIQNDKLSKAKSQQFESARSNLNFGLL